MELLVFTFSGGVDLGDETLDGLDFFGATDQDARSRGPCASGSAGAVHVGVGRSRDVVMDDERDGGDVETAGSDVGGHENASFLPGFAGGGSGSNTFG